MSRAARIRFKVKHDQALNLSELAFVSGYDRNALAGMMLPLQSGKIFYSDFRRVLTARQDRHEASVAVLTPVQSPAGPGGPGAVSRLQADVDKFRAPKSKRVRPTASRAREESQLRSTG
jgi:hypothetical protein